MWFARCRYYDTCVHTYKYMYIPVIPHETRCGKGIFLNPLWQQGWCRTHLVARTWSGVFWYTCMVICCSVLQCVAVCCSLLQSVAVYVAVCCSVLQCGAMRCIMLQRVLVHIHVFIQYGANGTDRTNNEYRAAKIHRMPYVYKLFPAKELYN